MSSAKANSVLIKYEQNGFVGIGILISLVASLFVIYGAE